jgi:hypothetical protein
MIRTQEPLNPELVNAIMAKLQLTYGRRFTGSYDVDPATVRAHWAHELAGLSAEGVQYALMHLPPDFVPNVLQFRGLAWNRPESHAPALPAPDASPERLESSLEALKGMREASPGPRDPVAWAYGVLKNASASPCAKRFAVEALKAKGRV